MKEQLNIALYLPSLRGGGGERVMCALANGLADLGCQVDFLLAQKKGSFMADLNTKVNVRDLGAKSALTSIIPLIGYIRRHRPQILISGLEHANLCALIARIFWGVDTKLIATIHVAPSRWLASEGGKSRVVGWLNHLFYRFADAVVAVSKGVAEDFKKVYRIPQEKVHVIYNPVIGERLLKQMTEAPQEIPGLSGAKYIVAVGNLLGHKDYPTLLKAFALLKEECAYKLVILGGGPEREALERLIDKLGLKGRVLLPGFVLNPYPLIKAAAVYVLSSDWEALPTVVIEALVAGIPIVSTNCEYGPDEILKGGKYGTLVPVADPSSLAQALRDVIAKGGITYDPSEATARFRIEPAARQYLDLSTALTETNSNGELR
jgi:glycosyltransferase involved in cell wall biosynthesis